MGRGVAFADFENRGSLDVLVANNGNPPSLLRNSADHGNHFINLKLVGTKSNRDAMGARVKLLAGGVNQVREISGGGSYLSQSDLRAHFGVGSQTSIDTIEIAWPGGTSRRFAMWQRTGSTWPKKASSRCGTGHRVLWPASALKAIVRAASAIVRATLLETQRRHRTDSRRTPRPVCTPAANATPINTAPTPANVMGSVGFT